MATFCFFKRAYNSAGLSGYFVDSSMDNTASRVRVIRLPDLRISFVMLVFTNYPHTIDNSLNPFIAIKLQVT